MSDFVVYGKEELDLVRKGVPAMREVLLGGDTAKKQSLLLALDWFLDPYYQQDISGIYEDLIELLQETVLSADEEAAEDALNLLTSYAWPPFTVLARNLDKVPERLRADALYAIHMEDEVSHQN